MGPYPIIDRTQWTPSELIHSQTQFEPYVNEIYQLFAGRNAVSSEISYYSSLLQVGYLSRQGMANILLMSLIDSLPSDRDFISRLYQVLFHREATSSEIDSWISIKQQGLYSRQEIVNLFYTSEEPDNVILNFG
jgi:DNA primase large subunit